MCVCVFTQQKLRNTTVSLLYNVKEDKKTHSGGQVKTMSTFNLLRNLISTKHKVFSIKVHPMTLLFPRNLSKNTL